MTVFEDNNNNDINNNNHDNSEVQNDNGRHRIK